ncbi:SDR family NAD(P)-dependent oxidoreductase [Chloroflexota bacterium]
MGRLDGRVAIVTGAGAGLGQATAVLFAQEGAKIVINDIIDVDGEETIKAIKEIGGEAIYAHADVCRAEEVKRMIRTAVEKYGKLDILVNNAAVAIYKPLQQLTEEDFNSVISVNLKGVWLGMKYAITEMVKAGGGSIINVASVAAVMAQLGGSIYSASKAGVIAMSKVAAVENGVHNIRVNCIKPGPHMTPMLRRKAKPEDVKRNELETPLGKLGQPNDFAQLALFLASEESSHITGQAISIDGGIEYDLRRIS